MGMNFNTNMNDLMNRTQAAAFAGAQAHSWSGLGGQSGHSRSRPNYSCYSHSECENFNSGATNTENGQLHYKLNVKEYKPCELKVKIVGNCVAVEGKHDEQSDVGGCVSRHFVRNYPIPEGVDVTQIVATLSSDGILTIRAPPAAQQTNRNGRIIEIQQTGSTQGAPGGNGNEAGNAGKSTEETTVKT